MSGECDVVVALVTTPAGKGAEIAEVLVKERVAACVNVVSNITSVYWWDNRVNNDKEDLLIIKTKKECYDILENKIREIHPYEVPEIISIKTYKIFDKYLLWACKEAECKKER